MRLFIYLSEILGSKVYDVDKNFIGRIHDVSVRLNDEVFPRLDKIILKKGLFRKKYSSLSFESFRKIKTNEMYMNVSSKDIQYSPEKIRLDLSLCKDIENFATCPIQS